MTTPCIFDSGSIRIHSKNLQVYLKKKNHKSFPKKALGKHLPRLYVTDVHLVGTSGFQLQQTLRKVIVSSTFIQAL